ncbi:hypothetical protein JXA85_01255 [Candidatus Woesearchaeota archaeon]|nr:hypothetical protein [Candidatus Woesearchaeota archaeon]
MRHFLPQTQNALEYRGNMDCSDDTLRRLDYRSRVNLAIVFGEALVSEHNELVDGLLNALVSLPQKDNGLEQIIRIFRKRIDSAFSEPAVSVPGQPEFQLDCSVESVKYKSSESIYKFWGDFKHSLNYALEQHNRYRKRTPALVDQFYSTFMLALLDTTSRFRTILERVLPDSAHHKGMVEQLYGSIKEFDRIIHSTSKDQGPITGYVL